MTREGQAWNGSLLTSDFDIRFSYLFFDERRFSMKRRAKLIGIMTVVAFIAAAIYGLGVYNGESGKILSIITKADAAGGQAKSPTAAAPDRYAYYPGTEELGPDEMRVVACGTGMPSARHGQAATCFLVELGNGDKFFFDLHGERGFPDDSL
jgi:hypothetical protein